MSAPAGIERTAASDSPFLPAPPISSPSSSDPPYFVHRALQVERIPDREGKWYSAFIPPEFANYGGVPLGGFLLALVLRALLSAHPQHPEPLTCTAEFIASPPVRSTVEIHVETFKEGRTFAFAQAKLVVPAPATGPGAKGPTTTATQPPQLCLHLTATLGTITPLRNSSAFTDRRNLSHPSYASPPLPPPHSPLCVERAKELKKFRWAPFVDLFRMHESVEHVERSRRRAGGVEVELGEESSTELPELHPVWMSCRDGQPVDTLVAAMFADTPLLVGVPGVGKANMVAKHGTRLTYSTVTMTLDFHNPVPPGTTWLKTLQRSMHRRGELTLNEFLCWSEDGTLVCSSRQQGWMREVKGKGKAKEARL
ncbi:hypothetical protein HDU93_002505 [Gonapodya sp. JEL0774]|nr:hypothetical protein HDU93_002505 [Gonapodya sp. JEL0774]